MLRTPLGTQALWTTLVVTTLLVSCRQEKASTTSPTDAAEAKSSDGVQLRYSSDARTLAQETDYEVTVSGGGQFGSAKAKLDGTLEVVPMGSDKLKVVWKIDSVDSLELKGVLEPKPKEGEPAPDTKQLLVEHGKGAFVVDLVGEEDDEATEALEENAAKDGGDEEGSTPAAEDGEDEGDDNANGKPAGARQVLALFEGIFRLPSLPSGALQPETPLVLEEEGEVPLADGGGPKLPMETETKYKLVSIDESGGARIVEVSVERESSGATEYQGGMLVVDQSTEATLRFDLNKGIPVSVEATSTQSFSLGDQGQEIVSKVRSTFTPRAKVTAAE